MKHMAVVTVIAGVIAAPSVVQADFKARLASYNEVPSLSTEGSGQFRAKFKHRDDMLEYELSYENLESEVQQAHIHLGQRHTNGGVMVFLCTNLGNGPAGTPPCPNDPTGTGEVSGMVGPDEVIGPAGQGIGPGEFDEMMDAIKAGAAYVNVHSASFPGGEIRGQIGRKFEFR